MKTRSPRSGFGAGATHVMLSSLTRSAAALALLPLRSSGFVAQMSSGGGAPLNVLGTPLKVNRSNHLTVPCIADVSRTPARHRRSVIG